MSQLADQTSGEIPDADLDSLHLLVIEDEPDAQAAIVSTLQACGAQVVAVDSIRQGLAALEQQRPDLVISDLHLPDGDGYSLMRSVRLQEESDEVGTIPGIAVATSARGLDVERVVSAGFKRYISKPIQPSRLVRMVATLTGRAD